MMPRHYGYASLAARPRAKARQATPAGADDARRLARININSNADISHFHASGKSMLRQPLAENAAMAASRAAAM